MSVQATLDRGEAQARKRHRKALWWDEDQDGHFVTLKQGWAFYDNVAEGGHQWQAGHCQGFDTVKEAITAIRAAQPCHCLRCLGDEL